MTPGQSAQFAYDAAAAEYDGLVTNAPRAILHEAYRRVVRPGAVVLDAGCGTGIDSAFLATLGAAVVGVDISERMLEIARRRRVPEGASVRFFQGDLSALGSLPIGPVDVIVSGFAALNTGVDLTSFGRCARSLLRPRGSLLLHVLTPGGLFDRAGHLTRGRLSAAFSGRRQRVQAMRIGGVPVDHSLVRPDVLYRSYLAADFELVDSLQTGAFTPDEGPSRVPSALIRQLGRLDGAAARWPWVRDYGRFGLLVLRVR